ncbi:MAG: ABC transporter permease [Hyphomonas sp.]
MIRIFIKDLRELMAVPVVILAVIAWSCAVLWFASALPSATRDIEIAMAVPEDCLSANDLETCPFPQIATMEHAINDLPGTHFKGVFPDNASLFDLMDGSEIDLVFAWHPTTATLGDLMQDIDRADFDGVDTGGLWIAYASPRSRAAAAGIRFAARQVQSSASLIENARISGRAPVLPTTGVGDLFSEWAPFIVALDQEAQYAQAYEAQERLDSASHDKLQELITDYGNSFGEPLPDAQADIVRTVFADHMSSWENATSLLFASSFLDSLNDTDANDAAPFSMDQALYFAGALDAADDTTISLPEPPLQIAPFLVMDRDGPARAKSSWLVPGLILITASAIAFMFTAAATVREREHGTEHLLFAGRTRAWMSPVLAKTFGPMSLALGATLVMVLFAQAVLEFEIKTGVFGAVLLVAIGIATAAFQGLIAGSLLRSQATALAASGAYLISLILFGDVFMPVLSASPPASWFARVLPVASLQAPWSNWMNAGAHLDPVNFMHATVPLLGSMIGAVIVLHLRRRMI